MYAIAFADSFNRTFTGTKAAVCTEISINFVHLFLDAAIFSEKALTHLGETLEKAKKETEEATEALPAETSARTLYSEACADANTVLVKSLYVVRAVFGPKSPEFKQFIAKKSQKEEDESATESSPATVTNHTIQQNPS